MNEVLGQEQPHAIRTSNDEMSTCTLSELNDMALGPAGLFADSQDGSYAGTTQIVAEQPYTDGLTKVVFACGRGACKAEYCILANRDQTWATLLANDDPQGRCADTPLELL